jgi:hypothetical protein
MYPTSAIALFCDDIRKEESGQLTLVGVMSDNIRLAPPHEPSPGEGQTYVRFIPKLGIYLRVNFDVRRDPRPVVIKVTMPDGEVILEAPIDDATITKAIETRDRGNPVGGIIQHLIMAGVPLKKLGRMTAEITADGQTYLAGFLNFVDS